MLKIKWQDKFINSELMVITDHHNIGQKEKGSEHGQDTSDGKKLPASRGPAEELSRVKQDIPNNSWKRSVAEEMATLETYWRDDKSAQNGLS